MTAPITGFLLQCNINCAPGDFNPENRDFNRDHHAGREEKKKSLSRMTEFARQVFKTFLEKTSVQHPVRAYLQSISAIPLLSAEKERELAQRMVQGQIASEKLLEYSRMLRPPNRSEMLILQEQRAAGLEPDRVVAGQPGFEYGVLSRLDGRDSSTRRLMRRQPHQTPGTSAWSPRVNKFDSTVSRIMVRVARLRAAPIVAVSKQTSIAGAS